MKVKVAVKHLGLVRSGLQSVDMDQIRSRSRRIQIQVSLQPIHRQILGLVGTLVISLVSRLPAFNIFPSQGFRQDAVNCNGQSVHIYIYPHYFTIFYPPDQSHPTKRILLRRNHDLKRCNGVAPTVQLTPWPSRDADAVLQGLGRCCLCGG